MSRGNAHAHTSKSLVAQARFELAISGLSYRAALKLAASGTTSGHNAKGRYNMVPNKNPRARSLANERARGR